MDLNLRIDERLDEIESKGLLRQMAVPRGIDLSSNDYLGLAGDQRLKAALIESVDREGSGATASRLLRGHREVFEKVEGRFAEFKRAARALYFSTGYQANVGILHTFLEEGDLVFSDELNHASLIDGIRLAKAGKIIYAHNDPKDLRSKIRATPCAGQRFLVTESLFSMDGDVAPLDEYAAICEAEGISLIVDEAHAVGIYGERGSGLIEEFGIGDSVFLSVNTGGKALGVSGAFVAGRENAIEYLVQRCRAFIFSTAPLPALAEALCESITIVRYGKDRRERLLRLCRTFRELLKENGFPVPARATQIVPVVIGESRRAVEAAGFLQNAGYDIRAIRPPTVPEGTSRLRISINVGLDVEVLSDLARKLGEAIGQPG